MALSDMLPSIDSADVYARQEMVCNGCGETCDRMDDGWARCTTCVIVFDSTGGPMEDETKELRVDFDLLPGSNPYLVERMNFDTMERETKRVGSCSHCRCSPDFLDGHYTWCLWANAQTLAKRSRQRIVIDRPQG